MQMTELGSESQPFFVTIRFYEELNDFLPITRRKRRFSVQLRHHTTVKDLIESCGVPHPEVDMILVNGNSCTFSYHMQSDDDVAVFPVFESLDISALTRLPRRPLRHPVFLADCHLGKLSRYLRLLGFDVRYGLNSSDDALARLSADHGWILLTRDRRLLMRRIVSKGHYLRSPSPHFQTVAVVHRFQLESLIAPFSRCLSCNGKTQRIPKNTVYNELPPMTRLNYNEFYRCTSCEKIYWAGAHQKKISGFIHWVLLKSNIEGAYA